MPRRMRRAISRPAPFAVHLHMAGDFVARPGSRLMARKITDWELVYFPNPSRTVYSTEGQSWLLDHPAVILTPPADVHSYEFDAGRPTRHMFVHFGWPAGDQASRIPLSLPVVERATAAPLIGVLLHEILYLAHHRAAFWEERIAALMASALGDFVGRFQAGGTVFNLRLLPSCVEDALAYMETHLGESFGVREMAQALGWSREHVAREFARCLGQSPTEVLAQKRMERARELLQQHTLAVSQIAEAVGYPDVAYFSRRFSAYHGMSPRAYRARCATDSRAMYRDLSFGAAHTAYPMNTYFHVGP